MTAPNKIPASSDGEVINYLIIKNWRKKIPIHINVELSLNVIDYIFLKPRKAMVGGLVPKNHSKLTREVTLTLVSRLVSKNSNPF